MTLLIFRSNEELSVSGSIHLIVDNQTSKHSHYTDIQSGKIQKIVALSKCLYSAFSNYLVFWKVSTKKLRTKNIRCVQVSWESWVDSIMMVSVCQNINYLCRSLCHSVLKIILNYQSHVLQSRKNHNCKCQLCVVAWMTCYCSEQWYQWYQYQITWW